MKILLIGLIAFLAWFTFSNYIYVCKIKGLCNETATMQISEVRPETFVTEVPQKPTVEKQIAVPETLVVYFAFDKSEINLNNSIEKYFDESNAYLKQDSQAVIKITGYADDVGTIDYNQALGLRRAQSMKNYFETKGMKAGKIHISSKGEREPSDNNSTKEGRSKNRKAVITINK